MLLMNQLNINYTLCFFILFSVNLTSLTYANEFDHSYKEYSSLLKLNHKLVGKQALVNYKNIKKDQAPLNIILKEFSGVTKKQYQKFTNNQKLAFLINSYNAFTIKLIIDHYPVKSIKNIGTIFTSAWKKKFFIFLGEKTHLDHVEHDLIRKNFDEPRIHFAVVCASIGCPNLQVIPFTAENLEMLLEKSAIAFIKDESKNSFNTKTKELKLSKIFKWYGDDFIKQYKSYRHFIGDRITNHKSDQKRIKGDKIKLSWSNYDWNLNKW